MIGIEDRKITVQTSHGPFEVDAIVLGDFAVHSSIRVRNGALSTNGSFTVTHVHSGLAASAVEIRDQTSACAIALMLAGSGINFGPTYPEGVTAEDRELANWIRHTEQVISATFTYERFVKAAEAHPAI